MSENIEKTPNVPPFVTFVTSAVPMVFDNSLSYYEALCALWKWLQDDVVNVINNNATVTEDYIQLTNEMKEYMDNYFDNLDVQEEINNKLDQMAEDGTLEEIMAHYLEAITVWSFDTVADMKASTNLVDGSYAQTAGFHSVNDGGGGVYRISNSGVANEMDVIAIGDLYAQLIYGEEANVKQFGAYADNTHDDSGAIQAAINNGRNVYVPHGTYKIDSKITINNKAQWNFTSNNSTFNYSGSDSAFEFRKLVYCNLDMGIINALSGNCIHFVGDSSSEYSQYNNIYFVEFSADGDCIKVESNVSCWISENRVEGGRFHDGANGIHVIQNSANGLSHWVINKVGVEGVDVGFNFEHGASSSHNIAQWEFSEMRHDESTVLFKSRGDVSKFLIITPERVVDNKFDVDSTTTEWKIINCDRVDYIYEGVLYKGAIDFTSKILWSEGINKDIGTSVTVTDQTVCLHLAFYADTQIDSLGHNYLIAKHLPRPKADTYCIGMNVGKDEAMPRYYVNTYGRLYSAWATNKKLYASGSPCLINLTYNINDLDDVILPND